MSHTNRIDVAEEESYDLQALRQMCLDEGWEWCENQRSFQVYMNKRPCQHAIRIPGCSYEIGVQQDENGNNKLYWDGYFKGGLSRVLGEKAERLKQSYRVAKVKVVSKKSGKKYWTKDTDRVGWKKIVVQVEA